MLIPVNPYTYGATLPNFPPKKPLSLPFPTPSYVPYPGHSTIPSQPILHALLRPYHHHLLIHHPPFLCPPTQLSTIPADSPYDMNMNNISNHFILAFYLSYYDIRTYDLTTPSIPYFIYAFMYLIILCDIIMYALFYNTSAL